MGTFSIHQFYLHFSGTDQSSDVDGGCHGIDRKTSAFQEGHQTNSPIYVDQDLLNWCLSWAIKLLNLLYLRSQPHFDAEFGTCLKTSFSNNPLTARLQGCHQHALDARQSRNHDVEGGNSAKPGQVRRFSKFVEKIGDF